MYSDINALDIETFTDDKGKITPFCICYLINKKMYSNYYNNENIILNAFKKIFNLCNNEIITIYVHNINFDGYLILEVLSKQNMMTFDVLIKNNSLYSITVIMDNKKLLIKCSYKIIPKSLNSISKAFKISDKLPFPHLFSNKNNLFYKGSIPDLIYFKTDDEYELLKKINGSFFDFKEYTEKYCQNDVNITSIFIKKIEDIVKKYNINFDKVFSAPSLSLKIFIKKFNKNKLSFNLKLKDKELIKNSYFGGRCEVYGNPQNSEYVNHFDFSGMYGLCMLENFPYGNSYIIEKPKNLDKAGFYYIEYYSNIDIPVLPHKSKLNNKLMFTNGFNKGIF